MKAPCAWVFSSFLCLAVTACDQQNRKQKEQIQQKAQQSRLEWHRQNLVGAYQTFGSRRAVWDTPAEEALELFAEIRCGSKPFTTEMVQTLKGLAAKAVDAGCNDPLVTYVHARYVLSDSGMDPSEFGRVLGEIAERLNLSEYNSLAKFFGCLRAAEASAVDIGPDHKAPDHVIRYRYATTTNLIGVIRDRTTPPEDVYQAVYEWLPTAKRSARQFPEDLRFIEPGLTQFGEHPLILLARAECAIASAWNARGSGYADTVTPEGWKLFSERLNAAKGLIEKAWKANNSDARIPTAMLDVAVGLSFERAEMEKWFDRAMKLNTNNYIASSAKLHYLKPQWHGSYEAMIAFGHECLSNNWGGAVPLMLVDAHAVVAAFLPKGQQADYWKDATVWQDVDSSYKRFFSLNPDAVGYRHNYAWYAYRAEQWNLFNEQITLFNGTNYSFFGGREEFERMVAKAKKLGR